MTPEAAVENARQYRNATQSGAYLDWTVEQLSEVQKQLCEARVVLSNSSAHYLEMCNTALEKVHRRIELKQTEERTNRQHRQVVYIGHWTLFWAIVGGLGTVGLLLLALPLPKLYRAMSSQWQQQLETKSPAVTPSATQSPSVSPTVSPQPTTTK